LRQFIVKNYYILAQKLIIFTSPQVAD